MNINALEYFILEIVALQRDIIWFNKIYAKANGLKSFKLDLT